MMTVITTMRVTPEDEDEWDALIRERFRSAHERDGWVSGQLLSPTDEPHTRVIAGTWKRREDWEAWHHDPAYLSTKARLDELQSGDHHTIWYDVIEDARGSDL